jgi:BMFP domain-containing protein YqiC
MNAPETSLEHRLLALEARVVALEKSVAGSPKNSRAAEAARDASESHLDLLSLIEDHVEVLKLIHNLVGPADRLKNKQVLTYIRRAETKLAMFQAKFAQLEARHPRVENDVPPSQKSSRESRLKSLPLSRLLRSAVRWNA